MADLESKHTQTYIADKEQVLPDILGGRMRVAWFESPDTYDAAQNDRLRLAKLPDGARVIAGRVDFGAFGAGVTLDIGDDADEDRYLAAESVASAGQTDFANTVATGMGHKIVGSNQTTIWAKFEAADPAADIQLDGYILYVQD